MDAALVRLSEMERGRATVHILINQQRRSLEADQCTLFRQQRRGLGANQLLPANIIQVERHAAAVQAHGEATAVRLLVARPSSRSPIHDKKLVRDLNRRTRFTPLQAARAVRAVAAGSRVNTYLQRQSPWRAVRSAPASSPGRRI